MQKIQTNIKIVNTGEKKSSYLQNLQKFHPLSRKYSFWKTTGKCVCVGRGGGGGGQIDLTHRPTRLRLLRVKTYFINRDILFMIFIHVSRLVNLG